MEIEHLKRVLERFSVDCVFDVGANDGQYATQLRKKVGYKGLIISFEPIPESAQIIREKSKMTRVGLLRSAGFRLRMAITLFM